MSPDRKTATWFCTGGLTLLGIVVFFLFFNASRSDSEETSEVPLAKDIIAAASPGIENSSVQQAVVDRQELTVDDLPKLPPLDYPPGSVGEACGVNDFPNREYSVALRKWYESWDGPPPSIEIGENMSVSEILMWFGRFNPNGRNYAYHYWNPVEQEIVQTALKKEQCRAALEQQVKQINPYLWGRYNDESFYDRAVSFVVTDNPMTFERIFTDPKSDLARVQEALARPECQLGEKGQSNWNLNRTCHADAFHNTALVMWFCYNEGIGSSKRADWGERTLAGAIPSSGSPEETQLKHIIWTDALEHRWVKEKCESLDLSTNPQSPVFAELRKLLAPLVNDTEQTERYANEELLLMAARLGDDVAGLTHLGYSEGRFADWFKPTWWNDPKSLNLLYKYPPSVDRFRRLLTLFAEKTTKEGKPVVVDQEALVQHLCTPPYHNREEDIVTEPPSCREIVAELRQELHDNQTFLRYIDTFEDVAMHLDVYE